MSAKSIGKGGKPEKFLRVFLKRKSIFLNKMDSIVVK